MPSAPKLKHAHPLGFYRGDKHQWIYRRRGDLSRQPDHENPGGGLVRLCLPVSGGFAVQTTYLSDAGGTGT